MKIILKIITFIGVLTFFLMSCDDKEIDGDLNFDTNKMVSFAQDTFYLPEDSLKQEISIVVPKYVNGGVELLLGYEDGTAVRDTHFYIDVLEAKIPIGGTGIMFPIEVFNDTSMNADRSFTLELLEVKGAAYAGVERQKCVIIIVNDDFPAEATAIFSQTEIEVYENKNEIKIPFKVVGGYLKGDASITFAYEKSVGTATEEHFGFINEGSVFLEKGDSVGYVILNIFNNKEENEDRWVNIYMGESNGVHIGTKELSTCKLHILDDDITRTIGYSVARDTVLENAGTMTVSVEIKGTPKFDEAIITGELRFLGPDSLAANRGLKIVEDPKFAVRGDTTLTYTIAITDNDNFESWGDSLEFIGVKNATLESGKDKLYITIADNERRLHFRESEYDVNENSHLGGGRQSIEIVLEGGVALEETVVSVTVLDGDTPEDKYELTKQTVTFYVGDSTAQAQIRVKPNPENTLDTYIELGLTTDNPFTSVVDGSVCRINMLNTDANVQLSSEQKIYVLGNKIDTVISVVGLNVSGDISVSLEMVNSKGTTVNKFAEVPLNADNGYKYDLDLRITNSVSLGDVSIQITSLKLNGEDQSDFDDIINPEFNKTTIYIAEEAFDLIDRSNWDVISYTTEHPGDGGVNSGMAKSAIDNDLTTFWHTSWAALPAVGGFPEPPHEIVYDMKQNILAREVEITARSASHLGDCPGMDIYLGDSETGPWALINSLDNRTEAKLKFGGASALIVGRYVKIKIPYKNAGGSNVASIAEFNISGNSSVNE